MTVNLIAAFRKRQRGPSSIDFTEILLVIGLAAGAKALGLW